VTEQTISVREELASSLTHGFGLVLSVAGLPGLIWLAARSGTVWHLVSAAVFGTSLVVLYASSTAYHSCRRPAAKRVFRACDHCAIYLLIAGSYTPFTLVTLRGRWGWALFAAIWTLCLLGIVGKVVAANRFREAAVALYVVMGWLAIVAIKPLFLLLSWTGLGWLLAGGLAYTAGLAFFALEGRVPYSHAIWHVFVMAGSACHYVAVVANVLLPKR
jgi:hemolysin III